MLCSLLKRKLSACVLFSALFVASWSPRASGQDEGQVFESSEQGLEFTIQVPPLWTTEKDYAGYAAVLKPSPKAPRIKLPKGMKADPTITIATSRKPLEVNEDSLEENARDIEENFTKTNGRWTEFQIFQKTIVRDLAQGASGLLYYISYKSDGVDVGQAVLLMGHEQGRFRVTLSDHRLNFDQNLETYYPYMVSLNYRLPEPAPKMKIPYDYTIWGVSVIVVSSIIGLNSRRKREKRRSRSKKTTRSLGRERAALSIPLESQISAAPSTENSAYPSHASSDHAVSQQSVDSSALSEPAFTASDMSSPPQSIPLSQVVDESSAPPSMRRRWSTLLSSKSGSGENNRKKTEEEDI